ncbi:hypothetical protein CDAR_435791 [Caerostris darwini]|uniref:Uncharacterized protein n=1 Tax=Caerostris darwini TaxID=1538125 RepID=A0AAV4PNC1_9ARAC|nr:hypothetical protein CDAR_435791 [Caerostris darwini]
MCETPFGDIATAAPANDQVLQVDLDWGLKVLCQLLINAHIENVNQRCTAFNGIRRPKIDRPDDRLNQDK